MSATMIEALDALIKRFEADGHRLMVHYDDDDLDRLWVQCRECGRVFCHEDIPYDLALCGESYQDWYIRRKGSLE